MVGLHRFEAGGGLGGGKTVFRSAWYDFILSSAPRDRMPPRRRTHSCRIVVTISAESVSFLEPGSHSCTY